MSELCINLDYHFDSNDKEQFIQKFEDSLTLNAITQTSNTALDDSSDQLIKIDSEKRNKMHKVHSKINGLSDKKNVVKFGSKSDSESSLDPWFNQQKEMDHGLSNEYTYSDEPFQSDDDICDPVAWKQYTSNIGESDSITEGPSQFREPRRKRKFRRMPIDPPVEMTPELISNDTSFLLKNKHIRNTKMQKKPKISSVPEISKLPTPQTSADNDLTAELPMALFCGKRKRSEEKSTDNSDSDISSENFIDSAFMKSCERFAKCMTFKSDSDGTSSESESECVLSTNDESREADDEQSDFFLESGPSKQVVSSYEGNGEDDHDDTANDDDDDDDDEEEDDEEKAEDDGGEEEKKGDDDDEDDDDDDDEDDDEETDEYDEETDEDDEENDEDFNLDEEVQHTAASEEKLLCKMIDQTRKVNSPALQTIANKMFEKRKNIIKEYLVKKYGKVPNSKIGARIFNERPPKYEEELLRSFMAAAAQRDLRRKERMLAAANDELMAEGADKKEDHNLPLLGNCPDSMPSSEKKAKYHLKEDE